jgi:hypothetical protein
MESGYFKIGRADDLERKGERLVYRAFEILPGALIWGTLFLVVLLSWLKPVWIAVFIISFVLYWLFRAIYFFFHLKSGFKKMREHERIDWLGKLSELENWHNIYHLVVFPVYKEPLQIVRESFLALMKTDYPKDKIIVILGLEERARDYAQNIEKAIEKEFSRKFFKFLVTWHPADLPGEIPGHSSNETWAIKQAKEKIIDPLKIPYQNIIVSSFDSDCQVQPKYFSCLTWHFLTSKKPLKTSYQPIPLYINNIWEAPFFSQIFSFTSTFWHMINQERADKLISFSSHAIPFQALVDVDFKQTNIISDDSRIFWQCFFKYDGDYRVQPLYYPVSMDANVSKNFFRTALNIYRQQKRWAYGVCEIPYFIFNSLKNKKISFAKKISFGFEIIEGHFSWATAPLLIFLLGWLPLILGNQEFLQTTLSYNLPRVTSFILTISMFSLVFSAYLSFFLLPHNPKKNSRWNYFVFGLGWLLVPLSMIFFSALPSLEAQTRLMLGKYLNFWATEKIRKTSLL